MIPFYSRIASHISLDDGHLSTWLSSVGPNFVRFKDEENDIEFKIYHHLDYGFESVFNLYTYCRECRSMDENRGTARQFCNFVLQHNQVPCPEELKKMQLMEALQ